MSEPTLTITVPVKYNALVRLLKQAESEDISVESLVASVLEDHLAEPQMRMGTPAALELALQRAREKASGEEFSLEDLFSEEEWSRIPGTRGVGRRFRAAVEDDGDQIARHMRKTTTNKAVYQRC